MGVYEWETCPHCGKRVSKTRRGVASDTTIGGAKAKCIHCGGEFLTGKTEWSEKSNLGRLGYYIRVSWWCLGITIVSISGGFIVSVILFGMIMKLPDEQWSRIGVALAVLFTLVGNILVIRNSVAEINESKERRR
jgi:DNA-directed RNA polymerase subunit RPC12/RpoP